MSAALSQICDYDSDISDEVTDPIENSSVSKLPLPSLFLQKDCEAEGIIDDPTKHSGRVRSFPHIRGNWSTLIYLPCYCEEFLSLKKLLNSELQTVSAFHECNELHLSFSKTFVLKFHWINGFILELQDQLRNHSRSIIEFDSIDVYTNEENTRTFVGVKISEKSFKYLEGIVSSVDSVLSEYKLPTYYKDPSFHISLFWCLDNKVEKIHEIIGNLKRTLLDYIVDNPILITVDSIHCKTGNKVFNISL